MHQDNGKYTDQIPEERLTTDVVREDWDHPLTEAETEITELEEDLTEEDRTENPAVVRSFHETTLEENFSSSHLEESLDQSEPVAQEKEVGEILVELETPVEVASNELLPNEKLEGAQVPNSEEISSQRAPTAQALPWWKHIWGCRHKQSQAAGAELKTAEPEIEPVETLPEPSYFEKNSTVETAATPILSLDNVHTLIQADVPQLVQAELARQQDERGHKALTLVKTVAESLYITKVNVFRMQGEVLQEEAQHTLHDRSKSLRERMEEIDYINECIAKTEQAVIQIEASTTQHASGATPVLAISEEYSSLATLHQALEQQKAALPALVQQAVAATPQGRTEARGGILWLTVLALVLAVTAFGITGFFILRNSGTNPNLLIEMASMYQAAGETDGALRVLDEAMQAGIDDAETLGRVGEIYRMLKQYDKAVIALVQALEKEPKNENYLVSLARSYSGAGRYQEAITQYQTLLEIKPDEFTYYLEMGRQYRSIGDYTQAMAQYQKVAEVNPQALEGYYFQADLYREQEKYGEAIKLYQKALEVRPNHYESLLDLGRSYVGTGEYDRAVKQHQLAIESAPDRVEAYYHLGEAYLAQGAFDQALEPYQQAIAKNEKYIAPYIGLGKAYVALDNCPNAIPQFTTALRLSPQSAEAAEGLKACTQ